jgi:aspartate--ammonia ligase
VEEDGPQQFDCKVGEGVVTDMRAVRKDYFLDHDHSAYVDQWDWERRITPEDRNLDYLKDTVKKIWKVIYNADRVPSREFPKLKDHDELPARPEGARLPARRGAPGEVPGSAAQAARDQAILQEYPAIFIIGIGWVLKDGYPHEMRAADYDDWARRPASGVARTPTASTATSWCGTR